MSITYVKMGTRIYLNVDGCIGSKICRSKQAADLYADRVNKGLVRFEPLAITAVRSMTGSRKHQLVRD